MTAPFFSIICPVYNTAEYLRECLNSVLAQTFQDWECICVDDGSTDTSSQILFEYQQTDKRFKMVYERNAGASRARNIALALATGKYICLIDSDDVILDNWLNAKYDAINKHPGVNWIRTRYRDWKDSCTAREAAPWPAGHILLEDTGYWEGDALQRTGFRKVAIVGMTVLNTYKHEVICHSKFREDVIVYEDCLFLFDNLKRMHSLVVIDDDSYRYRLRQGSVSHRLIDTSKFVFVFRRLNEIWSGIDIDSRWSTYWIHKVFTRYLPMIDSHSWGRGLLLRREFSRLSTNRSLNLKFIPNRAEQICWYCFLMTGLLQCFHLSVVLRFPGKAYRKIIRLIQSLFPK
jgi:glycosyltransferase involved in cell wall biosynthesis